jgi:hypothetical protein
MTHKQHRPSTFRNILHFANGFSGIQHHLPPKPHQLSKFRGSKNAATAVESNGHSIPLTEYLYNAHNPRIRYHFIFLGLFLFWSYQEFQLSFLHLFSLKPVPTSSKEATRPPNLIHYQSGAVTQIK